MDRESGKFEQRGQAKPYAALVNCIADICNQACEENVEKYKTALLKYLKRQELDTLLKVFSDTSSLVEDRSTEQTTAGGESASRSKEGLEKLKYTL